MKIPFRNIHVLFWTTMLWLVDPGFDYMKAFQSSFSNPSTSSSLQHLHQHLIVTEARPHRGGVVGHYTSHNNAFMWPPKVQQLTGPAGHVSHKQQQQQQDQSSSSNSVPTIFTHVRGSRIPGIELTSVFKRFGLPNFNPYYTPVQHHHHSIHSIHNNHKTQSEEQEKQELLPEQQRFVSHSAKSKSILSQQPEVSLDHQVVEQPQQQPGSLKPEVPSVSQTSDELNGQLMSPENRISELSGLPPSSDDQLKLPEFDSYPPLLPPIPKFEFSEEDLKAPIDIDKYNMPFDYDGIDLDLDYPIQTSPLLPPIPKYEFTEEELNGPIQFPTFDLDLDDLQLTATEDQPGAGNLSRDDEKFLLNSLAQGLDLKSDFERLLFPKPKNDDGFGITARSMKKRSFHPAIRKLLLKRTSHR